MTNLVVVHSKYAHAVGLSLALTMILRVILMTLIEKWIKQGAPWFSDNIENKPYPWDEAALRQQLSNILE